MIKNTTFIESMEVIPMSNESKWEEVQCPLFDIFITTDYNEWLNMMSKDLTSYENEYQNPALDDACLNFAKNQKAFMLAPTAVFGSLTYIAKTLTTDDLNDVVLNGPLYHIVKFNEDDVSADKNVEKVSYYDAEYNEIRHKTVTRYSKKKMYIIRHGEIMNSQ